MKRLFTTVILLGFVFSVVSTFAQERTKTIGLEKYREIIENYTPYQPQSPDSRQSGVLIYSENFDGPAGTLPAGWTSSGSSTSCVWNVDATPNPPGFYSADYSLNYNNGVTFDCSSNWGWVQTGLIPVSGNPFEIEFEYLISNECGGIPCGFDQMYVTVFDDSYNVLFSDLPTGNYSSWSSKYYYYDNPGAVDFIRIEFYFDTYDPIANAYSGPFIDDLAVYGAAVTPISWWAIAIGIFLIVSFTVLRFRRLS